MNIFNVATGSDLIWRRAAQLIIPFDNTTRNGTRVLRSGPGCVETLGKNNSGVGGAKLDRASCY
jgi:hypothetical protein